MSTITSPAMPNTPTTDARQTWRPAAGPPPTAPPSRVRVRPVRLHRVLASEWIKLWSLRSSWWTLVAASAALIVTAVILANTLSGDGNEAWLTGPSGTLQGYQLSMLLFGVLGVLSVSGEYGTGMIRSTFAAVPKRWPVLIAKTTVTSIVVLLGAAAATLAAFLAAQQVLGDQGYSLTDEGALRAIAGIAALLTVIAIIGSALGWVLRSSAAGISSLVALIFVVPVLATTVLGEIGRDINPYLPTTAGETLISSIRPEGAMTPAGGLLILCAWAVVGLIAATIRLRSQDV